MQKCIVLIGPPCSGKSTVGKELASQIGYKYVSSGDIARKMATEEQGISDDLDAGKMAPEDRMREEIAKILNAYVEDDIILDGFPRFEEQWEWIITNFDREFAYIIIDVPTLDMFSRAMSRGRIMDNVAFMDRLEYYVKNTMPMINRIDDHCTVYGVPTTVIMNNVNPTIVAYEVRKYLDDWGYLRCL